MKSINKDKVSIIVPCYNMGKYIPRFLDSVLKQDYENIELIMINDGSKDETNDVLEKYRAKLKKKKIELKYIVQKNKGVSSTINCGLAVFTGDFITWCDPDDFFSNKSISKKVNFLKKYPEFGFVRSNCYMFDEDNLTIPIGLITDFTILETKKNSIEKAKFNENILII